MKAIPRHAGAAPRPLCVCCVFLADVRIRGVAYCYVCAHAYTKHGAADATCACTPNQVYPAPMRARLAAAAAKALAKMETYEPR